jgi:hypothetical protein
MSNPSIKEIIELIALDYRRGRTDFYENILISDQQAFLDSVFEKLRIYGYSYAEANSAYTTNMLKQKCQPGVDKKVNAVGWAKNVNRRIFNAMANFYGAQDLPPPIESVQPVEPRQAVEAQEYYVRSSTEIDRTLLKTDIVEYKVDESVLEELGLPEVLRNE